jgi:hydrogenase maturation protein HypF
MFSDIDAVQEYCYLSKKEEELLKSSGRPIVLLKARVSFPYEVAKESRYIGAFLPSAGVHRLLTDAVGPLIVTSANISDEPIIIDDKAFTDRFLSSKDSLVCDVLTHKRAINIPQDDSVMFVTELEDGSEIVSFNRRARGYVPLPVFVNNDNAASKSILALGGDLKNTFALGKKDRVILSPYIGDLKDYGANVNERKLIDQFSEIFNFKPEKIVCDLHPLYESSAVAQKLSNEQNLPILRVQHHHAHILSVMAEKALKSCIGISFDGTGYGTDGKIWGGEILYCNRDKYERKGHLSYVKLCGGDNASKNAEQVRQCYEVVCGLADQVPDLVKRALENNIGTFETSSMGRLFDAVSELLSLGKRNSFEGECAILLENAAWRYLDENNFQDAPALKMSMQKIEDCYIIDQVKLFKDIKTLRDSGDYSSNALSFSFHMAIAEMVSEICSILRNETGENKVCLSGGVFGNRMLLKYVYQKLQADDFEVFSNNIVPSGDSGISLGQAYFGLISGSEE